MEVVGAGTEAEGAGAVVGGAGASAGVAEGVSSGLAVAADIVVE